MTLLRASKHKELSPEQLKWTCSAECFEFESTSNVEPIEGIIGQERALKALNIGVDLKSKGYNIFITGLSGTGKFTTIKNVLEKILPGKPALKDYAYVNNFDDPDRPMLLTFPAGKAARFKKDIAAMIGFLETNIPKALENEPFLSKRKNLTNLYTNTQRQLMSDFETELRKNSFTIGKVEESGTVRPEIFLVVDDKAVMIDRLDELVRQKKITPQKAEAISKKYAEYQQELHSVFSRSLKLSQEFMENISKLEMAAVSDLVDIAITDISKKYKSKNIKKYLDKMSAFIVENISLFKPGNPELLKAKTAPRDLADFYVNIILDNSRTKEAPVIIETAPSYANLFGSIEKYSDGSGGWFANFTKIKAGSILRANNGFLVLNAKDAYLEPGVWKTLKRVLLYGALAIQDNVTPFQMSPSLIKPEPIKINTKVILIGNNRTYSLLSAYEDDFNKIFKIKADFDYEMTRNEKALNEYARIIKKLINQEKMLEFDKSAIGKIAEYGARYAGGQNKLTTRFAYIADLAREADYWAKDFGDKIITSVHIAKAYESARERHGLYESKLTDMIKEGTILIDTEGTRIGQINGLAVYGAGNYSFGKPTRITASVSLGSGNIVNVEREAGLSGSSHNKAVLIISGYLKEKFGKRIPLSFNANIVFEQGYGMIDGDSASITEIAALLSTISEIPIKQSLAITGSVNQKGDIQPIGGVNEKIEGFFDICKLKGLTKKQGVIIPHQNVKDLMLKDEIIEAVKNKEFHIYPVKTVEEAIEILTGIRAGKLTAACRFHAGTVFGEVEKHLREMRRRMRPAPKPAESKKTSGKKTDKDKK